MFAAFEAPGYTYIAASAFAFVAAWAMDALVLGWVILELTDSPFWVGAAAGIRGTSQLLFSIAGGTLADRFDRRRTLLATYAFLATVAATLCALAAAGQLRLETMLPLVVLGGATGLMGPSSSSLTYDVVGPAKLLNASAFSFMNGAIARTLSGVVGGLALDRLGIAPAYGIVAAMFLATGAALLPLRVTARPRDGTPRETSLRSLRGGLQYAMRSDAVRQLLILSAITEVFGFAYLFVLPILARDVLHVSATGLGALTSMSAAGQFVAMAALALAGDVRRKGLLLIASTLAFGLTVFALALSTSFVLSLVLVFFVGAAASLYDTSMWTVTQMTASADMRGRVMGLYMATFGLSQVGGFIVGAAASVATLPVALGVAGVLVTLNALRTLPRVARFTPEIAAAPLEPPPAEVVPG